MQTFIICLLIAALFILVLGVSTRIIEDLTEIELDVMEIKRELKRENDWVAKMHSELRKDIERDRCNCKKDIHNPAK